MELYKKITRRVTGNGHCFRPFPVLLLCTRLASCNRARQSVQQSVNPSCRSAAVVLNGAHWPTLARFNRIIITTIRCSAWGYRLRPRDGRRVFRFTFLFKSFFPFSCLSLFGRNCAIFKSPPKKISGPILLFSAMTMAVWGRTRWGGKAGLPGRGTCSHWRRC